LEGGAAYRKVVYCYLRITAEYLAEPPNKRRTINICTTVEYA